MKLIWIDVLTNPLDVEYEVNEDLSTIELECFLSEKERDELIKITAQKLISENEQKTEDPIISNKFMVREVIKKYCSFEEKLSTTYKQFLSDGLESKYNQEIVTIEEKLKDYPNWDREEQIKRNQKALKKLQERHQKTLQIDDQEADQRQEEFERFKQLIDQFRPQGSKLYSDIIAHWRLLKKEYPGRYIVIATTNVKHLSEFTEALKWENIK